MKKLLLFLAAVSLVSLVSCKRDGAGDDPLVVGEWSPSNWFVVQTVDGEVVFENDWYLGSKHIFRQDGTGHITTNFPMIDGRDNWQTTDSFKWTLSDNKVFFTDYRFINPPGIEIGLKEYSFETEWTIHKLTSTELYVSFTRIKVEHPNEQEHHTVTLEKVK